MFFLNLLEVTNNAVNQSNEPQIWIPIISSIIFFLGNFLIINGVKKNKLFTILIGIFLTGIFWGAIVYFIASSFYKQQLAAQKKIKDLEANQRFEDDNDSDDIEDAKVKN